MLEITSQEKDTGFPSSKQAHLCVPPSPTEMALKKRKAWNELRGNNKAPVCYGYCQNKNILEGSGPGEPQREGLRSESGLQVGEH